MATLLEVRGLRIETDQQVLVRGIDLALRAGEVRALVGASGSGKSLSCLGLLDLLPAGVLRSAGNTLVDGLPATPAQLRGRQVALVLQNPRRAFNPVRTLRQHAVETLQARGIDRAQHAALIAQSLADVGLSDSTRVLQSFAFELSGGMLQRMMIALALLAGTPFLLADEPTSDLDVVSQARFLDLLRSLVQQRGLGVLLVTHDMGVVAHCADRVSVMHDGQIVEDTDVHSLFKQPRSATAIALLAAHNVLCEEY